jgi:hypothetical protein
MKDKERLANSAAWLKNLYRNCPQKETEEDKREIAFILSLIMEKDNLGPWFKVQGLTNLSQVADYIVSLQAENSKLRED